MAYMNQDKKAVIAAALKRIVPKDWHYTLKVDNYSTIVMTVRKGPVDFIGLTAERLKQTRVENAHDAYTCQRIDDTLARIAAGEVCCLKPNHYWLEKEFDGELLIQMQAIVCALNTGNWNRSDVQSDYFDVGHYIELRIGDWQRPYLCTAKTQKAA